MVAPLAEKEKKVVPAYGKRKVPLLKPTNRGDGRALAVKSKPLKTRAKYKVVGKENVTRVWKSCTRMTWRVNQIPSQNKSILLSSFHWAGPSQ